MNRDWMYGTRGTLFETKVEEFFDLAIAHQKKTKMAHIPCPCAKCHVRASYSSIHVIKFHISKSGFMPNYRRWTFHGESVEPNVIRSSNHIKSCPTETEVVDANANTNGCDSDPVTNSEDIEHDERIDEMLNDVEDHLADKPTEYQRLLDASKTMLFPGCMKYTKLTGVLTLFNIKGRFGWGDRDFTELLRVLGDMFPDGNELPNSTYDAKKLMCPMGIEYQKIHACPNNCILYRGKYAHLDRCPKCPLSRYKLKEGEKSTPGKKGIPAKVLWYLPIIPRFKRMFSNAKIAEQLRWHAQGRKIDDKIRHPADASQWKNIDRKFMDHFGREDRNLRLGLCTDGMNPYGTLSSQHSTWPVLLVIYNLPSWLCMKRKYIMLSLLISGPKQPGHNIDVYLAPLVDDLKLLWNEGTSVYDAYAKEKFRLRAMLFCTINDFPAYGNLSGYTVKGYFACPICEEDTCSDRLHFCGKNVYMDHRRFLSEDHPYRKKRKLFNGEVETRVARLPLTPEEVYEKVKDIINEFGLPSKSSKNNVWKKFSIFWELPYWKHLPVRHCLDLMHIEKNVAEALIATLLNMVGKTKDGLKVRKDMEAMGIRVELHPIKDNEDAKRTFLPPACYTLSKMEKISFCKFLYSVKVPLGYSSNWKNLVSVKDLKLVGLKSHDYHVLMQHLLPVAIRGILPDNVRNAITRLCFFFNAVCNKVIDSNSLDSLQRDIVVTLCQLEMYFPPSFFDIMVHLVVHLVREIKLCGPVYLRYMYPFERYMGILKGRMKNRYRPEGSIVEASLTEEVIEFCTDYLEGATSIGLPKSRHQGGAEGKCVIGHKIIKPSSSQLMLAELYVLHHLEVVEPYIDMHMAELSKQHPLRNKFWLTKEHNKSFVMWFRSHVMKLASLESNNVSEEVKWLALGPGFRVTSYEGFDINGYTFWTKRQDDKSLYQNSGVKVEASTTFHDRRDRSSPVSQSSWHYGVIQDIWELNYNFQKFVLFNCKWVDNRHSLWVEVEKDLTPVSNAKSKLVSHSPGISSSNFIAKADLVDKSILSKAGPNLKFLHLQMRDLPESRNSIDFTFSDDILHYEVEKTHNLYQSDLIDVLKSQELNTPIFFSWIMYLHEMLSKGSVADKFAFLCPEYCSSTALQNDHEHTQNYIYRVFLKCFKTKYIMLPYYEHVHWTLIVVCVDQHKVLYFDSLDPKIIPPLKIRPVINRMFEAAMMANGVRHTNRYATWHIVKCPKQPPLSTLCGNYVMRFMYDIISLYGDSDEPLEKVFSIDEYSPEVISSMIEDWAEYIYSQHM